MLNLALTLVMGAVLNQMIGQRYSYSYRYYYYGPLSAGRDGLAMGCRELTI